MLKYLSFHNFSFTLIYFLNVKWQGHNVTHPMFVALLKIVSKGAFTLGVKDSSIKSSNTKLVI
jgi:hypothetical protein